MVLVVKCMNPHPTEQGSDKEEAVMEKEKVIEILKNRNKGNRLVVILNKDTILVEETKKFNEALTELLESQPETLSEEEIKTIMRDMTNRYVTLSTVIETQIQQFASALAGKIPKPQEYCECGEKSYPTKINYSASGTAEFGCGICGKQFKPLPEPESYDIKVMADEHGKLTTPIYIGIEKIEYLGIYEVYGKKWWVVKADDKEPEIEELELSAKQPHEPDIRGAYARIFRLEEKTNELIRYLTKKG